jgi:D-sedoheptulose 7-phosphate isomerase
VIHSIPSFKAGVRMSESIDCLIQNYFSSLKTCIDTISVADIRFVVETIRTAAQKNKKIIFMGNGGSAANASHMVNDLSKGALNDKQKRLRVLSLNDNVPLMLAWGNDNGYDRIFVEQLKNIMDPDDVVIAISGSGNSPNVLEAVKYANENQGISIGLTGFDGGQLKNLATHCVIVPSNSMQQVEDLHLIIGHILMTYFKSQC